LAQSFQFLTPLWQKSFGIPQDSGHQQRAVHLGWLVFWVQHKLVGGFNTPKNISQVGSFPQVGVKIKNV